MNAMKDDQAFPGWISSLVPSPEGKSESFPMPGEDILVCAPNWLGDCILAMPAIQALKSELPGARITVLAREELLPLWRMNPEIGRASCRERV